MTMYSIIFQIKYITDEKRLSLSKIFERISLPFKLFDCTKKISNDSYYMNRVQLILSSTELKLKFLLTNNPSNEHFSRMFR
jgi:hypothetical protein